MKCQKSCLILLILTLSLLLSSCSQVSITGRRQLNFVPDSIINSMSLSEYNKFLEANKLSSDPDKQALVKRVGSRIANAVTAYCQQHGCQENLNNYQWEFNLVEDPNINAWAMPGGKVVVYTGLLPVAQNEDGLAVVIAHEIAHAFAEHGAERMSQQLLFQMGGMALDVAMRERNEQTRALLMGAYGMGGQLAILLPYSRLHENEADRLGLIFMALAGYDVEEAISFWQRMSAKKEGQAPPEYLSTHPSDETRIQNIRNLLPEAKSYYRPAN